MRSITADQVADLVNVLRPALEPFQREQLRDRIATEAMGRLIGDWCFYPDADGVPHSLERTEIRLLALQAYRFADAMLAAREVQQ
jgi:hypothetical protein